jgi:hypothetical protein
MKSKMLPLARFEDQNVAFYQVLRAKCCLIPGMKVLLVEESYFTKLEEDAQFLDKVNWPLLYRCEGCYAVFEKSHTLLPGMKMEVERVL